MVVTYTVQHKEHDRGENKFGKDNCTQLIQHVYLINLNNNKSCKKKD